MNGRHCGPAGCLGRIHPGEEGITFSFSLPLAESIFAADGADGMELPRGLEGPVGTDLVLPVTEEPVRADAAAPPMDARVLNTLFGDLWGRRRRVVGSTELESVTSTVSR